MNKIKEERFFINTTIETEKARLHGEREERAPEAERERGRAKVGLENKLAQQNLMDKVLCEDLEEMLIKVSAAAYPTFIAVSRNVTQRIAATVQVHDKFLEDALNRKNSTEEEVSELKEEVEIFTKVRSVEER